MPPPPPPPPSGPPPPPPGFGGTPSQGGFPSAPYGFDAGYGGGQNYAGFGSRLGGYLLDSLLYGLVAAIFAVPGFVLLRTALDDCYTVDDEFFCPDGAVKGGALAASIALFVAAFVVVAVLYLRALGRTGQTWGRKIAGVKVVNKTTNQPLGVGKAFLRCLVAGIVSGNCILGYLWMLWDKDKQTWHDKIVGSVVLKV